MSRASTKPNDLYSCYLRRTNENKKNARKMFRTQSKRTALLKALGPLSRKEFEQALAQMSKKGKADFEAYLRRPLKEELERVEQTLRQLETDPRLRDQVRREVKAAMSKVLKPR